MHLIYYFFGASLPPNINILMSKRKGKMQSKIIESIKTIIKPKKENDNNTEAESGHVLCKSPNFLDLTTISSPAGGKLAPKK